jgi:hypothetical protein
VSPSSNSGATAGLYFGRDSVSCVRLQSDGGSRTVASAGSVSLAVPLFKGVPPVAVRAALLEALVACCADIRGRHVPVHIVIPDAAISAAVFELDQVPASADALGRLVELRLARELGSAGGVCVSQLLGPCEGKTLLLGASVDKAWLGVLLEACAAVGVVPWSLTSMSGAVFNGFHDSVRGASGALITLTPESWALWVWDAAGLARPLRSQWRGGVDDEPEIAAEVERALIAYTDGHSARAIDKLHLWNPGSGDALGAVLDGRVRTPCSRWSCPETLAGDAACTDSPVLSACVVAALAA